MRPTCYLLAALAVASVARADASLPSAGAEEAAPATVRDDLDGDGRSDTIQATRAGGRYRLVVRLSRSGRRVHLPFAVDRYRIFVQTGGGEPDEPVINLEIAAIPPQWRARGVHSRFVAVHLRGGRMWVENLLRPPGGPRRN